MNKGNIYQYQTGADGRILKAVHPNAYNPETKNGEGINRTSKQTLAGLTTYAYDAAERLVKVNYPTGSEEYRYDKAGNRTEKLINGNTAERYQYDARNRLVSQDILSLRADGTTESKHKEYTYDEQGNMLTDGTRNFAYDAMNRLSQVTTTDGNTQKNRYDGEGLRAEMEENGRLVNFLFDGEKVIAETDGDQNVIRYIRGYDLISSDSEKAKTYYHYASDEMGSITHVIDEAGNVCNHYEYDAFGDFTVKEETIQNRFGFTGEQFDPVAGLYYLRARFYNPVIGRFIQEDTYYGDGLNLYTYCQNNPVKYIDPSGFAGEICDAKNNAINELKKNGVGEDAENIYQNLRNQGLTPEEVNQKVKDWNAYLDDIEKQTGRKITEKQRQKLFEEISDNPHSTKLVGDDYEKHRKKDWKNNKDDLIEEWEEQTGQTWPTYGPDDAANSGNKNRKENRRYDAHEIIPNVYDSPMEWWNLHPAANGSEHQGGIHRGGAPIGNIFPDA